MQRLARLVTLKLVRNATPLPGVLVLSLLMGCDGGDSVAAPDEDVTATIEGTLHQEKYFTPAQMASLERRAEEVGTRRIQASTQAWANLFGEFGEAMARGVDPAAEEVRALALRARALIREFTGGDPGIEASLRRRYQEEGGTEVMNRHGGGMDPELWRYYGGGLAALGGAGDAHAGDDEETT